MAKELIAALIDILWPKNCHICSKIINRQAIAFDQYICTNCFGDMKKTSAISCQTCAGACKDAYTATCETDTPKRLLCSYCSHHPPVYQRLISCYQYEGAAKKLIHAFKYQNRPYLSKSIAKLINNRLSQYNENIFSKIDYIVAVPLHPARAREREFNQSQLIALELSKQFKKESIPALKKIRHTKSQTALNRIERFLNLSDAFVFNEKFNINDKNILIVDDVVTTSATVREAANVLKKSGASEISVLTFAKGSSDENTA